MFVFLILGNFCSYLLVLCVFLHFLRCVFHGSISTSPTPWGMPGAANLSNFVQKELVCVRRYNDFVWVREQLVELYPGVIVPPIPEKSVKGVIEKLSMISAVQEPPRSLDTLARRRTKCEVFFFSERPQSTLKIFIFYKKPVKPFRCTRGHCMECFLPYPKSSPPGGPGGKLNCLFTARNVVRTWKHGLPPSLKSVCRTLPPPPNRTPQPTRGFRPGGGGPGAEGLLQYRQRALRKFLVRVGAHPVLCTSDLLREFLELREEDFNRRKALPLRVPHLSPPPPPGKASCSH